MGRHKVYVSADGKKYDNGAHYIIALWDTRKCIFVAWCWAPVGPGET